MLRVLHVLDHSLPLHSGYTFRTRAILKAQKAAGIDAADGPAREEIDGLIFHRTRGAAKGLPGLREWREIARLADATAALCESWRPDVIHAHSPALCGQAALRAARAAGLPLVYEIRAFWEDAAVGNGTGRPGSVRYRLTRALETSVAAGADAVITICAGLRDDLIERWIPPTRLTIVPNGVDLALFGEPSAREPALAAELGLDEGPVIGFIGSFYDYEGLDDLIAAMPGLLAREPQAKLLLVGGGPCDEVLRSRAAASPAAASIRFVGRVPHEEVERYYALIDVLAYPRKRSRLTDLVTPLKPLEALAQGRLVAASNVGGHRELVKDGLTGTLFAPDDPEACAAALGDLLADRSVWDRRRASGRAHVAEAHDWASNVQRYQAVYQRLITPGVNDSLIAAA
jgi:glycogen synthase